MKTPVEQFNAMLAAFAAEHPEVKILALLIPPDGGMTVRTSHPTTPIEAALVLTAVTHDLLQTANDQAQKRVTTPDARA